jgi:hypothetical protein
MPRLQDLLLAWAPMLVVFVMWMIVRPKRVSQQMSESLVKQNDGIDLARESLELQKKTLSCLEEIKAELKRQ